MMSSPPPPTTTSSSSSGGNIPVTAIIILSAIVVLSAIVILILRHNKRSAADSSSPTSDVVASRVTPEDPDLSLPIFTYGSIGRSTSNSDDCAVCLSRFVATDRLRLLPLCCHAFHVECIDTWLRSNRSCPLCRSSVDASDESQLLAKAILLSSSADGTSRSFRLEIGSVSRRDPNQTSNRRSYSVGSLDYVFDEEYEVVIQDNKEMATEADVASGRSMLMDYVDRVSLSLSSRAMSFRSSVSFFTGSSRRNEVVVGVGDFDMEVGRAGEEISEMFRWVSGL